MTKVGQADIRRLLIIGAMSRLGWLGRRAITEGKGRADALRAWHQDRRTGVTTVDEADLIGTLDTCLGCKACASTCPVQVDIPAMRAAFYADVYARKARPLIDRAMLLAERLSP